MFFFREQWTVLGAFSRAKKIKKRSILQGTFNLSYNMGRGPEGPSYVLEHDDDNKEIVTR